MGRRQRPTPPATPPDAPLTIAEFSTFTRRAKRLGLTAAHREDLHQRLRANPTSGTSMGHHLFKLRIALRGGSRVIYVYDQARRCIHLVFLYLKSEQKDLTRDELAELQRLAGDLVNG